MYIPLISTLGRQSQAEFQVSLLYRASSKTAMATLINPVSKIIINNNDSNNNKHSLPILLGWAHAPCTRGEVRVDSYWVESPLPTGGD